MRPAVPLPVSSKYSYRRLDTPRAYPLNVLLDPFRRGCLLLAAGCACVFGCACFWDTARAPPSSSLQTATPKRVREVGRARLRVRG